MKRETITIVRQTMAELTRQGKPIIVTQNEVPSALLIPLQGEPEDRERIAQALEFNSKAAIQEVV